jgi:hypothetical protein
LRGTIEVRNDDGDDDNDDEDVVVFADDDEVEGIAHIFDSVELTKLSFGLLGLHIASLCC